MAGPAVESWGSVICKLDRGPGFPWVSVQDSIRLVRLGGSITPHPHTNSRLLRFVWMVVKIIYFSGIKASEKEGLFLQEAHKKMTINN